MSQWELSERAGVHKNTPGLIERGERSPALETINAIAGALGVRGSDLLRLAEQQQQGR
ncbi:MAG: Helix-turn-helix domain [Solirubrobacteraceae bacterium]|nr:Helix-turn-helix domain [Solirubrobacteraceae bacterium]